MATPTVGSETSLRLERTLAAPREKVFAAWTQAEALKRWFAPGDEFTVHVSTLDPRVGGEYRIEMRHPSGNVHTVVGKYREVTAPSKLVFTWAWKDKPEAGETVVTVELHEKGKATQLVLTHERFPNAGERDEHQKGWTGCLGRLERSL